MTKRLLGPVPTQCQERLLTHYGAEAQVWLDIAPDLLTRAAERWQLALGGYHDAGHASAIAMATTQDGRPLLLKAWTDPARYLNEVRALRLWDDGPTAGLVEAADDLAVAALEMVGGRPGGAGPPQHEVQKVAAALQEVHMRGRRMRQPSGFPLLVDHLQQEMLPRVQRRLETLDLGKWRPLAQATLPELAGLREDPNQATVLHADLYRENVPFDSLGLPRLIDPLPMVGDAVFDWAFWTVYYDLGRGTSSRLATAARTSRIPVPVLAPWCRSLALDGLLFYVETGDRRVPRMAEVLSHLSASTSRGDL